MKFLFTKTSLSPGFALEGPKEVIELKNLEELINLLGNEEIIMWMDKKENLPCIEVYDEHRE